MITILSPAIQTNLTSLATVKSELNISDTSYDARIARWIVEMSRAAERWCDRLFCRQGYLETLGGYGDSIMMVEHTPLVAVSAINYNGAPITTFLIQDLEAGLIYLSTDFWQTQNYVSSLTSDAPAPNDVRPDFSATYVSGYLVPDDDVSLSPTISVNGIDNSFNDSASKFPINLQAGDRILASGFSTAGNNGWFTVLVATTSKIIVSATTPLSTEAVSSSGGTRSIQFHTLPDDLERGVIEAVKAAYFNQTRNRDVSQKHVGAVGLSYFDDRPTNQVGAPDALPPVSMGYLKRYRRQS